MRVLIRLAAFVVAVGLVVAAVYVRLGDEGGGDGGGSPGPFDDGPVAASCPRELRGLCERLAPDGEVRWSSVTAVVTAAALEGDETTDPALLPAAWADVVDDARARAGRAPLVRSEAVARTPLLTVAFADRAEVLAGACDVPVAELGWACVGQHAGERWEALGGDVRWGSVVPGHLPPDTATGLQATTAVVAARTGIPFSLTELRDVGFTRWFGQVERAVVSFDPPGRSFLTAMVTRGPSTANVAVATEAEVATHGLDTAFGPIVVATPEPLLEVELVAVGSDADRVEQLAELLADGPARAAFDDAGWRTGPAAPTGSPVGELPAVTDTPDGGVLTAVRTTWEDVAG